MFDVSPTEFFTIALIALIIFGPQRLPEMARKLGGYMSEIRKAANDLRAGLDDEVRQIQDPLTELKKDLTKPVSEIKQTVEDATRSITTPVEEAAAAADGAAGTVEWIGPEPETGIKPGDAWEGLTDPVPDGLEADGNEAPAPPETAEGDQTPAPEASESEGSADELSA
jgi:sec-independent protein translocase protein TatB